MKPWLSRILTALPFLFAAAFSIKSLREPDLWWQIRTGQWILEHGRVPTADPFSFTHLGKEWINIKWGFEVIAALISQWSGPESVFLLQLLISLLIIGLFHRLLRYLSIDAAPVFFLSASLLLFGIEYRIIGRPEMFTHLFTLLFVVVLLRHRQTATRWIWILIPVQILWSNLHEAFGMGPVILLLFTAGSWAQERFQLSPSTRRLMLLTLLSVGAILINPRGTELLLRPLNIFQQVQTNKYTTELSAFWTLEYWEKEAWLFVLVLCLLSLLWVKNPAQFRQKVLEKTGLGYLLVFFSFAALGLTAYRNLVFPILLSIPLLAIWMQEREAAWRRGQAAFAVAGLLLYAFIVSGAYYKNFRPRDHYGLQTLSINNPVGVANYIQSKGLSQRTCFSDYLTSSYLLWRFQPGFKTYIDLRDLDVFSNEFFDVYLRMLQDPEYFHQKDLTYRFQYVVLFRQTAPRLHAYLYNDSIYACTYADPVAIVYEKTDEFTRGDIFTNPQPVECSPVSNFVNHLFNPAYRPYDYEALSVDYEAAEFYYTVGMVSVAEKRINTFLNYAPDHPQAMQLKNDILELKRKLTP